MIKIYRIIILLLCFYTTIKAQNETADNLNKRLNDLYISNLTSIKKFNDPSVQMPKNGVLQDNELGCSGANSLIMPKDNSNPLRVDGQPLDFNNFYIHTKGVLSLANDKTQKSIPFHIYIRRDGKIINDAQMPFTDKDLYKIDLSEIFKFCKPEDRLIIKPVNAEDFTLKRILRLVEGC